MLFLQDVALAAAVARYKDYGWDVVAQHVGRGFTKQQCGKRWNGFLEPLQSGLRKGVEWTQAEVL